MRRQGYPESTLKATSRRLRHLNKYSNVDVPETVKACIANKNVSDGYKSNLVKAYDFYVKVNGLEWEKPKYSPEKRIPRVPTKESIDRIIARASHRYATIFTVLKETGMMPVELHRTRRRDIDLEHGTVHAPGCKGHEPRVLELKPQTVAMLQRYLSENYGEFPFPSRERMYDAFRRYRNDLAEKLNDPSLKQIRLYDLRHYFGTMLYHKTKDILYTKQKMGHRKVETTLIYAQLINFEEDEWTSAVAKDVKEARELIEEGFEYVTEMEEVALFRKRK